jgi:uncharacterized membrane-anchored protein YhcB (DUF1043 family)
MAKANISNEEDMGKYARHPRRTAGSALLIGTAIGASIMAMKKNREKNSVQKLMDKLG